MYSEAVWDSIAMEYVSGAGTHTLSKKYGMATTTILKKLKRRGVVTRKPKATSIDTINKIHTMFAAGDSIYTIAMALGIDHTVVKRWSTRTGGVLPHGRPQARKHADYYDGRVSYRKAAGLRHSYNLSVDEYEAMYKGQGGSCAICGKHVLFSGHAKDGVAHVDHDHKTGKVRGLLCSACNTAIGSFRDSPELLEKAAGYLRKHQGDK